MTIVKGATYDCAIMPLKFWSNDKHCAFSLRKLRCRKHCFRWLCLTKGQQQLWCNSEYWLPRCYQTKVTTAIQYWSSASITCVSYPQTYVLQQLGLWDHNYHYHASWKMSVKMHLRLAQLAFEIINVNKTGCS